ncbi:hypothetical protein ACW185_07280 [Limosilactobacillus fermentum]
MAAGGHLASMLGSTNGGQFDVGDHLDVSSDVQVAVPWYGVVDPLTAKQGSTTDAFDFVYRNLRAEPQACPELDAKANPLTYVSKSVPFLILHGQQDQVVPVKIEVLRSP